MSDKQRSDGWFDARVGRFTASEISKLTGVKGLGETGKTYAIEKAIESLFGKSEEDFTSFDMRRGIELEPLAFNKFSEIKDLDFLEVKEAFFFPYGEHAGASPDGVVSDNAILEIKCPRMPKFFKIVSDNNIDDSYLWQMQMQMMCSNSDKAYFFNYLIEKGIEYWHEIIVPRQEEKIDLIKKRLEEAISIKLDYINKINSNKQW